MGFVQVYTSSGNIALKSIISGAIIIEAVRTFREIFIHLYCNCSHLNVSIHLQLCLSANDSHSEGPLKIAQSIRLEVDLIYSPKLRHPLTHVSMIIVWFYSVKRDGEKSIWVGDC